MKLFHTRSAFDVFKNLFLRFPVLLLTTVVGTVGFVVLQELTNRSVAEDVFYKITLLALLAIPWILFVTLLSEKQSWTRTQSIFLQLLCALLAGLYAFVLPKDIDLNPDHNLTRLFILVAVGWLLAISVPYTSKDEDELWSQGVTVGIRAVLAAIFSFVFWVGASLSITAIAFLFFKLGREMQEYILQAWGIAVGILAAWFWFAGFPTPGRATLSATPRMLRLLLSYVCLPLLGVFFLILYTYLGKVTFTLTWPEGGVANWIIAFSAIGYLVYVFSSNMAEREGFRWLRRCFTIFFASVIPMSIMLFFAIAERIQQHGLTEKRYGVIVAGIWLLGISLYYLIHKKRLLQVIPYSAVALLLVSVIGPWSAFSLSVNSQFARLKAAFEEYGVLSSNGLVVTGSPIAIPGEEYNAIRSRIGYLLQHGAAQKLQELYEEDLFSQGSDRRKVTERAFHLAALTTGRTTNLFFSYSSRRSTGKSVTGYDYVMFSRSFGETKNEPVPALEGPLGGYLYELENNTLVLQKGNSRIVFSLNDLLTRLKTEGTVLVPSEMMVINGENETLRVTLHITKLAGKGDRINTVSADILVDVKQ